MSNNLMMSFQDKPGHWASITPHANCAIGIKVRSKRRPEDFHGTIFEFKAQTFYQWNVRWQDGSTEWCRDGELREAKS